MIVDPRARAAASLSAGQAQPGGLRLAAGHSGRLAAAGAGPGAAVAGQTAAGTATPPTASRDRDRDPGAGAIVAAGPRTQ